MDGTDDHEGSASTLPRRQLGRFLREEREKNGLTIEATAKLADLSKSALQRIEAGRNQRVRKQDVRALCQVYDVGAEDTEQAVELAVQARTHGWYHAFGGLFSDEFNMYVGLEASARQLIVYHEQVPGLLQTRDYARQLISAFYREGTPEDIDRRVELRMRRQRIITRKTAPLELEVLLHESALHRVIGGNRVMSVQLRHLAEAGKLANVTIRISPYTAGMAWGILHGQFVLLGFGSQSPVEPPLVYLEGGPSSDVYIEKPAEVQRYHDLASDIRSTALDESASRDLLRRTAKEFDGEH
ncbi:helix-turn-helix domain-containing protein [Nocardia yamanashiensis]|uniref:helix-turn-helix domain-containing protein n=1 Tax=Nocardia yamanashiensis TaxID=209247 RepID=UPI001E2CA28E|nr:helix-turn-helix transcriptional regulator [Nocardia yamanashiensis]UGT45327.1 helix-turn-helix domain-containing protein [Nocardia yamanashiensis]